MISKWRIGSVGLMGWCCVALLQSTRADYPNAVLLDSPDGYWRLNDQGSPIATNSGTAGDALDGSIIGNEPRASGPSQLADGTPVSGMGFENVGLDIGSNLSYVDLGVGTLSGLSQFTLSGWFNPRSLSPAKIDVMGQSGVIELGVVDSALLQLSTALGGSVAWDFTGSDAFQEGGWVHLAAVGTGSALNLFVNGENVASGGSVASPDYGTSSAAFRVAGGDILGTDSSQFEGTIDDLAFWDTALTQQQLVTQFRQGLGIREPGDFNIDGATDLTDLNLLLVAAHEQSTDSQFDVTGDEFIDEEDVLFWVQDIALTWVGDADLDGEFTTQDFVKVFQIGEYEDAIEDNSLWHEGDWTGDLDFTSSDFVAAFQDGGFELGPIGATAVPEPSLTLLGLSTLLLLRLRRTA